MQSITKNKNAVDRCLQRALDIPQANSLNSHFIGKNKVKIKVNNPTSNTALLYCTVIAAVAALSGILFGFDTGVISGAILFINKEFHLTAQSNGFVVSSVLLGALLGALISGVAADRIGRRRLLIIDAIIFICGTLLSAYAQQLTQLIAGRIIVGLAIGIASYVAPLYIAEISPARLRGRLVSLNQLAIAIGILISYCVDYGFATESDWRGMFLTGLIPAILLLIGMILLPASPRWLMRQGRPEQTRKVLRKIRGKASNIEQEVQLISATLAKQKYHWRELFNSRARICLTIGVSLAIIQQITGINTILYYAPTILNRAGLFSANNAIFASIFIGLVFVIFTIAALPLIDSLGRKPLLYLGLTLMAVGLCGLSLVLHDKSAGIDALVFMLIYIGAFAISLGPIVWLLISEIFPLRIRGLGSSIATASNWGSNWLVAFTFLSLINYLGTSFTFLLFAGLCLLSLILIYYYIPETKNCSLETIENNLYAGVPARDLGK